MNQKKLFEQIKKKRSFLSIGLDVDLKKIPPHLLSESDPIFSFCKKIIDSTNKYAIAYKPNIAFFESYGAMGWKSLEKVSDYLSSKYPEIFSIADAKRGDIGNTAYQYARAFFENLSFDSITVNPYMGRDSVEPFLSFKDKSTILLTLTSNYGADDFQFFGSPKNPLFERVIEVSKSWNNSNRLMYVIGANQINQLKKIRGLLPDSFFLIPGVGAQGGDLIKVILNGINDKCGLIINSSRQIIYADSGLKFQKYAKDQAIKMQEEMEKQLLIQGII
jgi:orotidine-5'-phosphate decarboxylase